MIKPRLTDEAFVAEVRQVVPDENQVDFWWLGQSGFLVAWQGRHLLLDPYLSDSLTRKYAATDKPHVRMTELIVAPSRLDFIDIATSSHQHTDHLDAETLVPLRQSNPQMALVIPEATRDFVANRIGCPKEYPVGLDAGQSVAVKDFAFHGIPAAHNDLETDATGLHRFMGFVICFGPWTIYHSGDTLRYAGMEKWLRQFQINLAFLPINGNLPARKVAGNLGSREAAQLARDTGIRLAVPCHYEMFTFNTASPEEFAREAERLDQPYRVAACGERVTLRKPGSHPKSAGVD